MYYSYYFNCRMQQQCLSMKKTVTISCLLEVDIRSLYMLNVFLAYIVNGYIYDVLKSKFNTNVRVKKYLPGLKNMLFQ